MRVFVAFLDADGHSEIVGVYDNMDTPRAVCLEAAQQYAEQYRGLVANLDVYVSGDTKTFSYDTFTWRVEEHTIKGVE